MTNKHQENNELVYKFQNGDDLAFTELFNNNKGLVHSVLNRYATSSNLRYIDKESFESAAYFGFIKASKTYNPEEKTKFSTYCIRLMEQEMLKEIQYIEHYGRKEGISNTESYHAPKRSGDEGSKVYSWLYSVDTGKKDLYFEDDFPSTAKAIEYALLNNKTSFKDYIVAVVCGDYSQTDIVDKFGVSKQVVSYQIKTFKKKVQEYLDYHKVNYIDLIN